MNIQTIRQRSKETVLIHDAKELKDEVEVLRAERDFLLDLLKAIEHPQWVDAMAARS